jgi:hypothetical protein
MSYYIMTCEGIHPRTTLKKHASVPRGPWYRGQEITYRIKEPLVYGLDPGYPGALLPLYESEAPIMREDLLDALKSSGVDNLQLFAAILKDPKTKQEYTNYKAVNVIGLVAAADMAKSTTMGLPNPALFGQTFDSLTIDEKKAGGALLFRLKESASAIVVHDRVKSGIEAAGVPGMTFYESGEWSG